MSSSIPSTRIAREFLRLANDERPQRSLTPIQLIKLTYLAHGWAFVYLNPNGLVGEKVEAWKYGPVFSTLYHALKEYGSSPVAEVPLTYREQVHKEVDLKEDEKDLIKAVYETYKELDGPQMITLTHQEGTPWKKTWKWWALNLEIKPKLIREYYHELHEERERNNNAITTSPA